MAPLIPPFVSRTICKKKLDSSKSLHSLRLIHRLHRLYHRPTGNSISYAPAFNPSRLSFSLTPTAVRLSKCTDITTMTNLGSLSADVLLAPGPNDSVSELRWSPISNHLTISGWDNILRVYEITQSSGSPHSGNLLFTHALSAPLLSCDWSKV